jgi:hypothetical protein
MSLVLRLEGGSNPEEARTVLQGSRWSSPSPVSLFAQRRSKPAGAVLWWLQWGTNPLLKALCRERGGGRERDDDAL